MDLIARLLPVAKPRLGGPVSAPFAISYGEVRGRSNGAARGLLQILISIPSPAASARTSSTRLGFARSKTTTMLRPACYWMTGPDGNAGYQR